MSRRIFAVVFGIHLVGLLLLMIGKPVPKPESKPERIVVSTVRLQPKPKPKSTTQKIAKRKPKAPPKKTQTVAKAKPAPSKKDEAYQKLLKEAQESIAKIEATSDKLGTKREVVVKPLQIDLAQTEANPYCIELAERIRLLLRLPDYGGVRVALTLDRSGVVSRVEVVASENKTNEAYVKESLTSMRFSPFSDYFPGEQQHTFQLTLKNEV